MAALWTVAAAADLSAQEFAAGDRIRLVEREIHIPAHPAPGDNDVPFRFAGGSAAVILAIDSPSGWLEIRGEKVGGVEAVGWITPSYVAGPYENEPLPDVIPPELAWCPAKGSPEPHPAGRLRIATWNLGNLHAEDGESTFEGSDPSVKRFAVDYLRIRCYVRMFDPDILAVQEVDGEEALRRVVDTDVYEVHVSARPRPGGMNGKQNTGFAFRKGLDVERRPDVEALDVSDGGLRRGARIDVMHNGHTLQIMSVHLKSGCFTNGSSGSSCQKLFQQLPVLESWIDEAAAGTDPFVVLGDFNRRLNLAGDDVWAELDDADPPNADLAAVTAEMPISCRDNEFTSFIDHIVFDLRAVAFVDRSSFRHITYRQADRENWDRISDHCPVSIEMWMR
jgi:endonuclease/exonuclease/phosphatase family metal-dependent hydrolase